MFTRPPSDLWSEQVGQSADEDIDSTGGAPLKSTDDFTTWQEWYAGESALNRGDIGAAIEADQHALRSLGYFVPDHAGAAAIALSWGIIVRVAHLSLARWLFAQRKVQGIPVQLLAARHCDRLAYLHAHSGAVLPALWAHLRALNLSEKFEPSSEVARSYGRHAALMCRLGFFKSGCAYADKCCELSRAIGGLKEQAQACYIRSVVLYADSRLADCSDASSTAMSLYKLANSPRETNLARCQLAASYWRLGRLADAIDEGRNAYQCGVEIGDARTAACALAIWAAASHGEIPPKAAKTKWIADGDDRHKRIELLLAEGIRLLSLASLEEAVEAFEDACQTARENWLSKPYLVSCQVWLATALREMIERQKDIGGGCARSLLRYAQRSAQDGRRLARRSRNDLPHALRECALVAALGGKKERALRLFEQSLAVANEQHACHEYAKTLEARGRIGKRMGWPDAGDDFADGRYMENQLKSVRSGLLDTPIADPSVPPG